MSIVFISPHFDDAILSTWTKLYNLNNGMDNDIKVLTICGGVPDITYSVSSADLKCGFHSAKQAALSRIQEDLNVCNKLSLEYIHLNELDYPYSGLKNAEIIISKLESYIKENDVVYAPFGIGNHPDHIISKDAIIELFLVRQFQLFLYFDFPYAHEIKVNDNEIVIQNMLNDEILNKGIFMDETINKVHLEDNQLKKKLFFLAMYTSQIKMLEKSFPKLMEIPGILHTEYFWEVHK